MDALHPEKVHVPLIWAILAVLLSLPSAAIAETATYHLHNEASTTSGLNQLKTAGPDTSSNTLMSASLNGQPLHSDLNWLILTRFSPTWPLYRIKAARSNIRCSEWTMVF